MKNQINEEVGNIELLKENFEMRNRLIERIN